MTLSLGHLRSQYVDPWITTSWDLQEIRSELDARNYIDDAIQVRG
jgi:hypothetical protein